MLTQILELSNIIVKNTIALYVRMLFIMGVTLYTSRVILEVLGVEDFGIYNVVAGVTSLLATMNASFSAATSRFITFELGKKKSADVQKVFQCSLSIHYLIALITLLLAETVGLWFVSEKLVVPLDKREIAVWVYQFSVFTALTMIVSTPYNALIISSERMTAFAIISIVETILKLMVVFCIVFFPYNRLVVYAALLLAVQVCIRIVYAIYCKIEFKHLVNGKWFAWDKTRMGKMIAYSGWMMSGSFAVMGYTQGINILLNLFFGPTVNAARAISVQVQSAVNSFANNVQTAVRPQVIKRYAMNDLHGVHALVIKSSKYSLYLMMLIMMPVLLNTDYILCLWLVNVPDYTIYFVQITLLTCFNYALSGPTMMAIQATGNIKRFQIIESTLLLSILPIAYLSLKYLDINPVCVLIIYLCIETITQFVRVFLVYPRVKLEISRYFKDILYPAAKVTVCLCIIFSFLKIKDASTFVELITYSCLTVIITCIIIFITGLSNAEKNMIIDIVKKKLC